MHEGPAGNTLRGSCLCGSVRYTAQGPFRLVARCHCVECRKQSGGEFATNATVDAGRFALVEGADLIRRFESSPGQWREFCGRCGSPLFKRVDATPEIVRLRLGCLDDPFEQPVEVRVFTREAMALSRLPEEGEPCFETLPGA
jgi:hypothetical protein